MTRLQPLSSPSLTDAQISMMWTDLPRTPEPEVMSDAAEVEAYASATAQAYLDAIDDTLVEQVLSFGRLAGWLLDIGTGPGGIPLKVARRSPGLRVVGVDQSAAMVRRAQRAAEEQGLANRVFFFFADAHRLSFPDAFFDLVLTNSLLHHLSNPVVVFNEMARVVKADGVVLARDLRRPTRLSFPFHVRWYGRHYSGVMKELYVDSVRAAYTGEELSGMLRQSALADSHVFFHQRTHLGFFRDGKRNSGT